jgi:hypothetical protein
MRATVKISQPNLQGVPIVPLPHRDAPTSIAQQRNNEIFNGQVMTDIVSYQKGMESYSEKHSVKWQEGNAFAAESNYHTYGGTNAARYSIPTVTLYAVDGESEYKGAVFLHQLIDFFAFCTKPWSKLGIPPLLFVTVGRRSFYGYMDSFDPTITEYMSDGPQGNGISSGLPYSVTFNLSFILEPLGTATLSERTKGLPRSVGLKGGNGGFVDPARIGGTPQQLAQQAVSAAGGSLASAVTGLIPGGGNGVPLLGGIGQGGSGVGALNALLPSLNGQVNSAVSGLGGQVGSAVSGLFGGAGGGTTGGLGAQAGNAASGLFKSIFSGFSLGKR